MDARLQEISNQLSGKATEAPIADPIVDKAVELEGGDETITDNGDITPDVDGSDGAVDNSDNAVNDDDITNFADLATAIEVEPEYLYGMEIAMGDNEAPVKLGELKDNYQALLSDNKKLTAQLEDQGETIKTADTGMQQTQQVSNDMQQVQAEMASINNRYNEIDWTAFEAEDPGGAALARQKFQEAHNASVGKMQQIQQYQDQTNSDNLRKSAAKLMELQPAWKDKAVREADQTLIRETLVGAGYPQNMLKTVTDPLAISMVLELAKLRAEKSAAMETVAKVRNAPKILSSAKHGIKKEADVVKSVRRAKTSGDRRDAESAVKGILKNAHAI